MTTAFSSSTGGSWPRTTLTTSRIVSRVTNEEVPSQPQVPSPPLPIVSPGYLPPVHFPSSRQNAFLADPADTTLDLPCTPLLDFSDIADEVCRTVRALQRPVAPTPSGAMSLGLSGPNMLHDLDRDSFTLGAWYAATQPVPDTSAVLHPQCFNGMFRPDISLRVDVPSRRHTVLMLLRSGISPNPGPTPAEREFFQAAVSAAAFARLTATCHVCVTEVTTPSGCELRVTVSSEARVRPVHDVAAIIASFLGETVLNQYWHTDKPVRRLTAQWSAMFPIVGGTPFPELDENRLPEDIQTAAHNIARRFRHAPYSEIRALGFDADMLTARELFETFVDVIWRQVVTPMPATGFLRTTYVTHVLTPRFDLSGRARISVQLLPVESDESALFWSRWGDPVRATVGRAVRWAQCHRHIGPRVSRALALLRVHVPVWMTGVNIWNPGPYTTHDALPSLSRWPTERFNPRRPCLVRGYPPNCIVPSLLALAAALFDCDDGWCRLPVRRCYVESALCEMIACIDRFANMTYEAVLDQLRVEVALRRDADRGLTARVQTAMRAEQVMLRKQLRAARDARYRAMAQARVPTPVVHDPDHLIPGHHASITRKTRSMGSRRERAAARHPNKPPTRARYDARHDPRAEPFQPYVALARLRLAGSGRQAKPIERPVAPVKALAFSTATVGHVFADIGRKHDAGVTIRRNAEGRIVAQGRITTHMLRSTIPVRNHLGETPVDTRCTFNALLEAAYSLLPDAHAQLFSIAAAPWTEEPRVLYKRPLADPVFGLCFYEAIADNAVELRAAFRQACTREVFDALLVTPCAMRFRLARRPAQYHHITCPVAEYLTLTSPDGPLDVEDQFTRLVRCDNEITALGVIAFAYLARRTIVVRYREPHQFYDQTEAYTEMHIGFGRELYVGYDAEAQHYDAMTLDPPERRNPAPRIASAFSVATGLVFDRNHPLPAFIPTPPTKRTVDDCPAPTAVVATVPRITYHAFASAVNTQQTTVVTPAVLHRLEAPVVKTWVDAPEFWAARPTTICASLTECRRAIFSATYAVATQTRLLREQHTTAIVSAAATALVAAIFRQRATSLNGLIGAAIAAAAISVSKMPPRPLSIIPPRAARTPATNPPSAVSPPPAFVPTPPPPAITVPQSWYFLDSRTNCLRTARLCAYNALLQCGRIPANHNPRDDGIGLARHKPGTSSARLLHDQLPIEFMGHLHVETHADYRLFYRICGAHVGVVIFCTNAEALSIAADMADVTPCDGPLTQKICYVLRERTFLPPRTFRPPRMFVDTLHLPRCAARHNVQPRGLFSRPRHVWFRGLPWNTVANADGDQALPCDCGAALRQTPLEPTLETVLRLLNAKNTGTSHSLLHADAVTAFHQKLNRLMAEPTFNATCPGAADLLNDIHIGGLRKAALLAYYNYHAAQLHDIPTTTGQWHGNMGDLNYPTEIHMPLVFGCESCGSNTARRCMCYDFGTNHQCGRPILRDARGHYCGYCHNIPAARYLQDEHPSNNVHSLIYDLSASQGLRPFAVPALSATKFGHVGADVRLERMLFEERVHHSPVLAGIGFCRSIPFASERDNAAVKSSLEARALAATDPHPDWAEVEAMCSEVLATMPRHSVDPVPFPLFISRFPVEKQRRLSAARQSLKDVALAPRDCFRSLFLKDEKLTKDLGRGTYAARVISSTSDRAQVALGPYTLASSKFLLKNWDGTENSMTAGWRLLYASGRTASEIGDVLHQWHRGGYEHVVDGDYSSFDSTVHIDALRTEHRLYRHLCDLSNNAEVALNAQLRPRGVFTIRREVVAKFSCSGRRQSGDSNTSVGNSFLNALIVMSAFRALGLSPGCLAICGDDVYVSLAYVLSDAQRDAITAKIRQYGMKLELNTRDAYYNAHFLGCRPLVMCRADGTTTWTLAPEMGRALAKFGWSLRVEPDLTAWMRGVAVGFRHLRHIPVLGALVTRTLVLLPPPTNKPRAVLTDMPYLVRLGDETLFPHPDTVAHFAESYGIAPTRVAAMEEKLMAVEALPCVIAGELFEPVLDLI